MRRIILLLTLVGLCITGCDSVAPDASAPATSVSTPAAPAAHRSPSSQQGWFSFTGTLTYPCLDEPVDMSIRAHYVWHSDTTPTGRYHYLDQWQAQMTGTGRYSGAAYHAQESTHYAAHWPEEGVEVVTFTWTSRLIQPGSGLRYLVRTTAHVTQHPDGTTSAEVLHDDAVCRALEPSGDHTS